MTQRRNLCPAFQKYEKNIQKMCYINSWIYVPHAQTHTFGSYQIYNNKRWQEIVHTYIWFSNLFCLFACSALWMVGEGEGSEKRHKKCPHNMLSYMLLWHNLNGLYFPNICNSFFSFSLCWFLMVLLIFFFFVFTSSSEKALRPDVNATGWIPAFCRT